MFQFLIGISNITELININNDITVFQFLIGISNMKGEKVEQVTILIGFNSL